MSSVLIVGAGPTGLVLAIELIRRGISVRLIDAKEVPEKYSRAMGIQSRTLEVFEKIGVLPAFLKEGNKVQKISIHWAGKQSHLSLENLDAPYPFTLILPQSDTERLLREHLESIGGSIEWNTRLINLDKKQAIIKLPSKKIEQVRYPWIIGCDGAHSTIRHALNLPFLGAALPETFLLADVQAYTNIEYEGPQIFLSKKGFGLIIPFPQKNYYRIICPGAEKTETPQQLSALLKERGLSSIFDVHKVDRISSFQIQRRHSLKFRQNSIFLAGDAAHIHSPFGGQGMNTSIQDAFNLGWKLALVIQNVLHESILDTYENERLPVAKMVLKETTFMTRLLTFSQKRFPPLFYWGIHFILSSKKNREKVAGRISEISLSYSNGKSDWPGPKEGDRAPDCRLADGKRVFDLMKTPKFSLLLFSENPSFVEKIQKEYGNWIDVQILKGNAVREKYAAEAQSVYLIRPDGYVGFRSQSFKPEEIFGYLIKIFMPASSRNKS